MSDKLTTIDPGAEATQGFGEQSLMRSAETSSTALAEQAKAAVQARYIIAVNRPRDLMLARKKLLADCARPGFAETALYSKPVGNEAVEGPGIRMAEAAARAMGNIYAESAAVYDDRDKRILRVTATDLEANVSYPMDVTIAKTIERRKPQEGRRVINVRKNSKGYDVYTIEATDEEILDKERAATSKALRTALLRLIPGDILEEAIEACYATRRGEIKKDPAAARKKMVDAFEVIGVSLESIAEYLGHAVDQTNPEEIDTLRALYTAIKDKETTWADALDAKLGRSAPAEQQPTTQPQDLAERINARAEKKKAGNKDTGELDPEDGLPKGL